MISKVGLQGKEMGFYLFLIINFTIIISIEQLGKENPKAKICEYKNK